MNHIQFEAMIFIVSAGILAIGYTTWFYVVGFKYHKENEKRGR